MLVVDLIRESGKEYGVAHRAGFIHKLVAVVPYHVLQGTVRHSLVQPVWYSVLLSAWLSMPGKRGQITIVTNIGQNCDLTPPMSIFVNSKTLAA